MASTIGHAMCGIACLMAARNFGPSPLLAPSWRTAAAFALLANLPDIDFLLGLAISGNAHRYHGGPTHTLAFALVAAAFLTLAWRKLPYWRVLPWVATAVASHVVVDLFTGPTLGFSSSYGTPLFWPFENGRIRMPFTAFLGVEHATFDRLLSLHNFKVAFTEIITFAPPLLLLWWLARYRSNIRTPFRMENQES